MYKAHIFKSINYFHKFENRFQFAGFVFELLKHDLYLTKKYREEINVRWKLSMIIHFLNISIF